MGSLLCVCWFQTTETRLICRFEIGKVLGWLRKLEWYPPIIKDVALRLPSEVDETLATALCS